MEQNNEYLEKKIDDHEMRLRRLEESDVQQRIQLTNIEKSQSDLKFMITEQSKVATEQSVKQQDALNNFTKEMIGYFQNKELKNDDSKFYNTKQFWAIVSMLVGGLLCYFGVK